jgi:uncharacterized protein YaiL (DUF2058 family)
MNSSLRDQLLAAGLVSEKQVRQATQQEQQRQFRKHHSSPLHKPNQPPPSPSAKAQAEQAQTAKLARDKELNRRREDKAQRRARIAEIERIIEQNRVPRLETDDHYSFIDGKKIRRMSVDPARREQLTKGDLVIVRYRGHYAVVPAPIAEQIRERDANMIVPVVQPKAAAEPASDDAYKDFAVPDDLMW